MKKLLSAVAVACFAMSAAHAATVVGLYNTGVDDDGAAIGNGMRDTHYSYIITDPNSPGATAAGILPPAVTYDNPNYLAENAGSRWVSVDDQGGSTQDPGLIYDYRTTFDLTGFDPATAVVSGLAGSDNFGLDILVNGVSSGQTFDGFSALTAFTLANGFTDGENTLDFIVQDGDAPTAFRVDGLTATASAPAAAVPEPASWAMFIGGFGAIGIGMRRQRRTTVRFG